MGIREGKARTRSCAPTTASTARPLRAATCSSKDILRGEWSFTGYVVSDCGAIDDIYLRHKVAPTAAAAAALAVKTGTDLDCGRVYPNLVDAVQQGLITEAQIDVSRDAAVPRALQARHVRPAGAREVGADSDLACSTSRRTTRSRGRSRASRSCCSRTPGNTLPLAKTLGTIAVIGPNADQKAMLLGNYNGMPSDPVTPLRGIREAVSANTKVLYARGSDLADGFPVLETCASTSLLTTPDGTPGLRAEYFAGQDDGRHAAVHARPTRRSTRTGRDGAPRADMNPDDFGVRWTANASARRRPGTIASA